MSSLTESQTEALLQQAEEYVSLDFNPFTKATIQSLIDERNTEELSTLMQRMEFGTAGLRFESSLSLSFFFFHPPLSCLLVVEWELVTLK